VAQVKAMSSNPSTKKEREGGMEKKKGRNRKVRGKVDENVCKLSSSIENKNNTSMPRVVAV
jgi:hypothetical protein